MNNKVYTSELADQVYAERKKRFDLLKKLPSKRPWRMIFIAKSFKQIDKTDPVTGVVTSKFVVDRTATAVKQSTLDARGGRKAPHEVAVNW